MEPEDLDLFLSYEPGVDAQAAVVDVSRHYLYGSSASGEPWPISALTFIRCSTPSPARSSPEIWT